MLFPAYAGVIPNLLFTALAGEPFPRICGGDPKTARKTKAINFFSPHTRG